MSILDSIKEKVNEANSILILTHENPDGDAVGSSLGFMHGLRKLGKQVDVLIPAAHKMYSFMPGFDEIKKELPEDAEYDLCISLDSSDLERLGTYGRPWFEKIKNTIVIDHHITNQNFGDVNYVNAVASSTCQNIIVVLAALDVAINKEMAICIYSGMLTDTGGFRYNVQTETFEFVAMLMEAGIDIAKIYRNLFDITSYARTKLLGRALSRMELFEEGRIALTYVTKEDMEELGCDDGDHEGIVDNGRNIEGVEVSVFLREKEGVYRVSLRSNEYVDVSRIASKYAGGGHMKASGFEVNMSFEQVKDLIISEIKSQLK